MFAFSACWERLLGKSKRYQYSSLESLPDEILDRMIFPLLSVKEIITLRRVSKRFCLLTKKPSVWHQQLQYFNSLKQPFAPVPPLPQYSIDNLKFMPGHELERIIRTAVSIDLAWKGSEVKPYSYYSRFLFQRIEEVKLLPGGHFMIVSCKTHDKQYGISLWTLNHPATHQPAPLLFRITDVKAYGLQTKYMTVKGEKGICITFTRRWFKDKNDKSHCPETFELGGQKDEEDHYHPFRHECLVLFVRATLLESLTDRRVRPLTQQYRQRLAEITEDLQGRDLWEVITRIRTPAQIRATSLDIIDGQPHVCVLKASTHIHAPANMPGFEEGERAFRKCCIEFKSLEDERRRTLFCMNLHGDLHACETEIWNFRVLPDQNQVLIVRNYQKLPDEAMRVWPEEKKMEHDVVTIGMYQIPSAGATMAGEELQGLTYSNHVITNCQISDPSTFKVSPDDASLNSILMKADADTYNPDPSITCFFRTSSGSIQLSISQTIEILPDNEGGQPQGKINKFYDLDNHSSTFTEAPASIKRHPEDPEKDELLYDMIRAIPGCRRSLVYGIPHGSISTRPPITDLVAFEEPPVRKNIIDRRPSDAIDAAEIENDLLEDGELPDEQHAILAPSIGQVNLTAEDVSPNDLSKAFPQKNAMRSATDVSQIAFKDVYADRLGTPVTAIHFDEHSGMLVAATSKDRMIHFISFARARRPDKDDDQMTKEMDMAFDMEQMRLASNLLNPLQDADN